MLRSPLHLVGKIELYLLSEKLIQTDCYFFINIELSFPNHVVCTDNAFYSSCNNWMPVNADHNNLQPSGREINKGVLDLYFTQYPIID